MTGTSSAIVKKHYAISLLREHRRVLVALSGGVDSATLLAITCEALGSENVLAVTGRSGSVTDVEVHDAALIARSLGVSHEIVETNEIDRVEYRANTGDRCFHCRSELFEILSRMAVERGIDVIVYGAIVDDLGDVRPGMKAARDLNVLAPLLEAGINKIDVRVLALSFGLHIHDKPANPCLASRIPIGTEVTPERLEQVGRAEAAVRRLGFRGFRVRHHGEIARIEYLPGEIERLTDPRLRADVVRSVKAAGFRFVVVDLEPYRESGLYSIEPARVSGQ